MPDWLKYTRLTHDYPAAARCVVLRYLLRRDYILLKLRCLRHGRASLLAQINSRPASLPDTHVTIDLNSWIAQIHLQFRFRSSTQRPQFTPYVLTVRSAPVAMSSCALSPHTTVCIVPALSSNLASSSHVLFATILTSAPPIARN